MFQYYYSTYKKLLYTYKLYFSILWRIKKLVSTTYFVVKIVSYRIPLHLEIEFMYTIQVFHWKVWSDWFHAINMWFNWFHVENVWRSPFSMRRRLLFQIKLNYCFENMELVSMQTTIDILIWLNLRSRLACIRRAYALQALFMLVVYG